MALKCRFCSFIAEADAEAETSAWEKLKDHLATDHLDEIKDLETAFGGLETWDE
jgi:hypothetical protein